MSIFVRGNITRYSDFAIHSVVVLDPLGTGSSLLWKYGHSMANISDHMLPPPEKCSQCGHPLGIAMRPTLQVLVGSATSTILLLFVDTLFTLSWALRLVSRRGSC